MIKGYASVFFDGTERTEYSLGTHSGRPYVERIERSAFDNALSRGDDVVALFNHDPNNVLGRSSSGTLKLSLDSRGLAYEIEPDETTIAQNVLRMQKRGDIPGSSFAFRVDKERIIEDGDKMVRSIEDVTLDIAQRHSDRHIFVSRQVLFVLRSIEISSVGRYFRRTDAR